MLDFRHDFIHNQWSLRHVLATILSDFMNTAIAGVLFGL